MINIDGQPPKQFARRLGIFFRKSLRASAEASTPRLSLHLTSVDTQSVRQKEEEAESGGGRESVGKRASLRSGERQQGARAPHRPPRPAFPVRGLSRTRGGWSHGSLARLKEGVGRSRSHLCSSLAAGPPHTPTQPEGPRMLDTPHGPQGKP